MRHPVRKFVLVASWPTLLACAVYDASLLEGHGRGGDAGSGSNGGSTGLVAGLSGSANASGGAANVAGGGSESGTGAPASAGTSAATDGGNASSGGDGSAGQGGDSGGQAGSGNEPTGGSPGVLVFDDMEDGGITFFLSSTLHGRWYLSHDNTDGEQTAIGDLIDTIPGGRGDSERAIHTTASGFSGWGASVGFTFENNAYVRTPFDASGYSGVSFHARVESGSEKNVRVTFLDMNTDPMGGVCGDADAGTDGCLNHFGVDLVLSTTFAEYVIEFDKLAQRDWGHLEPSLEESKLLGMEVSWGISSIDIWIDDLTWLP